MGRNQNNRFSNNLDENRSAGRGNRNIQNSNYDFNQDRGPRDDYNMGMYDEDSSDFDFGRSSGRYNEGRRGRNDRDTYGQSEEFFNTHRRNNWDSGFDNQRGRGSNLYDQDRDFSMNERNRRGGIYDYNSQSNRNMSGMNRGGEDWRQEGRQGQGQGLNFFGKGPKGWKRTDDRIKEEVCEALSDSWMVDASEIDVQVKDGHVTLKGTIDSREGKREAERCVENLRGVQDVQNDLKVSRSENVTDMRRTGTDTNQRTAGLS